MINFFQNIFSDFLEGRETPLSPPPPSNSSIQTSPRGLGYTCGPIDGSLYAVVNPGGANGPRGSPLTVSMDSGISSAPPQRPSPPEAEGESENDRLQSHGDLDKLLHDMMLTVEVSYNATIFYLFWLCFSFLIFCAKQYFTKRSILCCCTSNTFSLFLFSAYSIGHRFLLFPFCFDIFWFKLFLLLLLMLILLNHIFIHQFCFCVLIGPWYRFSWIFFLIFMNFLCFLLQSMPDHPPSEKIYIKERTRSNDRESNNSYRNNYSTMRKDTVERREEIRSFDINFRQSPIPGNELSSRKELSSSSLSSSVDANNYRKNQNQSFSPPGNIDFIDDDIPYHARQTSQPFTYGATTDMIKQQKLSSPSLVRKASVRGNQNSHFDDVVVVSNDHKRIEFGQNTPDPPPEFANGNGNGNNNVKIVPEYTDGWVISLTSTLVVPQSYSYVLEILKCPLQT